METIRTQYGDIDLSFDWREYFRGEVDRIIGDTIRDIALKSRLNPHNLIDERINKIMQSNLEDSLILVENEGYPKPNNGRMLLAHGDSWDDKNDTNFFYHEVKSNGSDSYKRVQDWIDEFDGRYDVLFIQACNPAGVEVNSNDSFLVYPNDNNNSKEISLARFGIGNNILQVKPPKNYLPLVDEQQIIKFNNLEQNLIKKKLLTI